jgi:hypothetical protein
MWKVDQKVQNLAYVYVAVVYKWPRQQVHASTSDRNFIICLLPPHLTL